jgi:rhamnosyltransferase
MNTERIAAVVILYHPASDVVENIKSYYEYVDRLYVFDNTDGLSTIQIKLKGLEKVQYFHHQQNDGVAKRLNQAAELAIKNNFNWLLTMDQDTNFSKEAIENYIKCLITFPQKESVAIFGTAYGKEAGNSTAQCAAVEEDNLITSGMLLNLNAYTSIGAFDENLFIDSVDHDYCIRAKLSSFSIIKFNNIYIQHNLGNEVFRASIKTLFLVRKRKKIHSPLRCYYMYRNLLYLQKKFEGKHVYLALNLAKIVKGNLQNSLLYGRESVAVIHHLILAFMDFKQNKMGKRAGEKIK